MAVITCLSPYTERQVKELAGTEDVEVRLVPEPPAPDAVRRAVSDACKQPAISQVLLEQPKFMGIDRLDATGLTLRMTIKTKPGEHWAVLRELRLAVTPHELHWDRGDGLVLRGLSELPVIPGPVADARSARAGQSS